MRILYATTIKFKNWLGLDIIDKQLGKVNVISGHKGAGKTATIEGIEYSLLGKLDGKEIAKAIEGLNFKSLVGTMAYTSDWHGGPQTPEAFKPVSFKNGEYAPPVF
jgi:hypothetical protein